MYYLYLDSFAATEFLSLKTDWTPAQAAKGSHGQGPSALQVAGVSQSHQIRMLIDGWVSTLHLGLLDRYY